MSQYLPATTSSGRVYRQLPRVFAHPPVPPKHTKHARRAPKAEERERFARLRDSVAVAFGVDPAELTVPHSARWVSQARQALMWLTSTAMGMPANRAAYFINRDRKTVVHGRGACEGRMRTKPEYAAKVKAILRDCTS